MLHQPIRTVQMLGITLLVASTLAACGGSPASTTQSAAVQPTVVGANAQATNQPTSINLQPTVAASSSQATNQPAPATTVTAKLNLNTLTAEQLLSTIPNFPNRMTREFLEYRPYVSIQQFRQEIGKYVSADQLSLYEQYVFVPIDVDQSDAATLQQVPGVTATTAQALIAARPYGSAQAFLTKLAEFVPDTTVQQAKTYLAA